MSGLLFHGFIKIHMKVYKEKRNIINLWNYTHQYGTEQIQNNEKLLGIVIDSKLKF